MTTMLPPLLFLLAAAGAAFAAQRLVRARRGDAECGDYWSRVTAGAIVILAPALLLSGWLETLWPAWYHSGRHLHLDLTGAFGWSLATCYLAALGVPLVAWLALLGAGLHRLPAEPAGDRWLAGGVGFGASRRWLLLCAAPMVAAVVFTLPRLGGGPGAHPAAAWATCALLGLSLAGVVAGEGIRPDADPADAEDGARSARTPWPEALEGAGVQLRPLTRWPGGSEPRPVRGARARRLAERLRLMGARHVAPELVETLDQLLDGELGSGHPGSGHPGSGPPGSGPPARLVHAPDDCGQLEVVALAAHLLDRRHHAHTLVVTAGDAAELAARLGRWLPAGGVTALDRATEIPPPELLWVADAGVLSDGVLPQLRDPRRLERIGLVVWWDLHRYSGVLAANLWAISRRLHRLVATRGRSELRTLAFLRAAAHPDAQLAAFAQRLLPVPLDRKSVVEVAAGGPRPVELHLLEAHRPTADAGGAALRLPLPLAAARASVAGGWPTRLDPSAELRHGAEGLRDELAETPLGERLVAEAADADARIHPLDPGEVLSLPEIFGHGGRAAVGPDVAEATAAGGPHHVGVVAPAGNPYAGHLLARLASGRLGDDFGTSRRLLYAQARGELMRRHLLLALSELPDTRRGLLRNFLLDEELVRRTLGEIAREGNLTRREVRHLDRDARLVIDHRYQLRRPVDRTERPLHTAGGELIEVRDPAAGGGVRLRVDRERVTVEAYPHRVFHAGGRRYRVDEWSSVEEVVARGWLACTLEDQDRRSWRRRHATVYDVSPLGVPVTVGGGGRSFVRGIAELHYEEEVTGVVQVTPNPAIPVWPRPESRLLDEPIRAGFATRALLLGFRHPSPEREEQAPLSLCEALRHVLPVHLGVEEDALELVPLWGDETPEGTLGVAVVDLYPGGIGLVDAVGSDDQFLTQLLRRTREWLAACGCRGGRGCCLDTPSARAAAMDRLPDHRAALELLDRAV